MQNDGRQLVLDICLFQENIVNFCQDPRNVEDIKNRSFDFAAKSEEIMKMWEI